MAIVLTKPKPQTAAALTKPIDPMLSDLAPLIDAVVALEPEALKIQARVALDLERLKPYKEAQKALDDAVQLMDEDDDAKWSELGTTHKIEIGKKGNSRSIKDMELVKKLMGNMLFMKVATVTLKAVDDYLNPEQKEQVLTTARTTRSVKIIKRV